MPENNENLNQELTQQQLSEQEGIRRDKLRKLVEAGNDPYTITHFNQSL